MPLYRPPRIATAEITDERFYLNRRHFMGAAAGGLLMTQAIEARAAALDYKPGAVTVDEPMTPGRFFENLWRSPSLTRLHIAADPVVAERELCKDPKR